jgi:hypothetical protein
MTRAAYSLVTLLAQINAKFPYRDRASDGGIGDAAHSARVSDHNPDSSGIYHAYDFDHDPDSNGLDCYTLKRELIASSDNRIKYIIFMRRIWYASSRREEYYSGVNAHDHHLHLSVVSGAPGDDSRKWVLPFLSTTGGGGTTPTWSGGTYCQYEDRNDRVMTLQNHMTKMYRGYNAYVPTGFYGDATKAGIAEFQSRVGIEGPDADGTIVGPRTMKELIQRGFRP